MNCIQMNPIVCRVCLDHNVKMHCIQDHKLMDIYEKLSSSKMNTEDGLPTTICYICVSQLQRCRRFFDMARESIKTLTHRIHSGLKVTSINATSENLGETHHLTVTTITHMTVNLVEDCQPAEYEDMLDIEESRLDDIDVARSENITHMTVKHVGDYQVKVKQEKVAVKEEPAEYEVLFDIEESRLDDVDVASSENIRHMTVQHVEDCHVKVKQEKVAVKEEPAEYENLLDIEESRLDDVDVASSENIRHMTVKHVEDCHVKVKQEKVAVKEEPAEYENLLDIEESRLDDVDVASSENIRHMTVKHVEDCHVKVKQEKVAVKEEPAEYENLLEIEENRHDDADVGSSVNIEQLKETSDQNQYFYNTKCTSKSNLIRHMKTNTEYKKYVCDICRKTFIRASHLKRHMRIHTGEKPYACDICKKTFNQSEALKRHLLIHTGESPYSCDICNKNFNRPGNLKQHMLIHTGQKPYACHICKKPFNRPGNLKKHMHIHTH